MHEAFLAAEILRTEECYEVFVTILRHDGPVDPTGGDIEDRIRRVTLSEEASTCGICDVRELNAKLSKKYLCVGVTIRGGRARSGCGCFGARRRPIGLCARKG